MYDPFFFSFFFFFELYQSEYHCYSKCLALFWREAPDMQCHLSPAPASPSELGWGWGGSTECLSAVVSLALVGSVGVPSAALPFRAGTQPPLDPLSARQETAPPRLANQRGATGPRPPALDLCRLALPRLPLLSHKDHFSWKLRQSYFWNLPVLF